MLESCSPSLMFSLTALFGALSCASSAAAQSYGARARVRTELASTHDEDASAAGTTIDLTRRLSLPSSLTDVMREAPGANVLSTGGIGAFASAQLRGADGEDTAVLLDDIPLTTPEGGAFDLSLIPPALLSRVEVYRGGAPVWLGQGAIGGVLRLDTRRDPRSEAAASSSAGSFDTESLQARAAVQRPSGVAVRSSVFARHTDGDYRYKDDGNTPSDTRDDRTRRIQNGQLDEASGFVDAELPVGPGKLRFFVLGNARTGGLPGPGSRPTPRIRRSTSRLMLATSYTYLRGKKQAPIERLQVLWSGAYGFNRYSDVFGQLGISAQTLTNDLNLRSFTRAAYERRITSYLSGTLLGSYAYDRYAPDNLYQFPAARPSDRHGLAGAVELNLHARRGPISGELRPSGRLELADTTLHAQSLSSGPFDGHTKRVVPTARVGAVIGAYGIVALSGSVATGKRLPSMAQLFGDRGLTRAAPDLKPVSATTYDVGLTLKAEHGSYAGRVESHLFWQERRDAIVLVRSGQYQNVYTNIGEVAQRGVESGFSASFKEIVRASGSFTYLHTDSDPAPDLEKRLPFRPRYIASLTPQTRVPLDLGAWSSVGAAFELNHRSYVFTDQANLSVLPACTKLNTAASFGFFGDRLKFTARMEDLADARCFNLYGYPLPGRSVFFSLSFEESFDASAT